MITFKSKTKSLNSYVEMGVQFGRKQKREPFESYSEFEHELENIQSSSSVNYDNQETAWRQFAENCGYDGLKELANAVAKLMGPDEIGFYGMEGLAALSGNKILMDKCDYGEVGESDHLIMSMFYGGSRMKQWKKYAKDYITPQIFIEELKNANNFGTMDYRGPQQVIIMSNNVVKVEFSGNVHSDTEENKKAFLAMLENGDDLFDFNIAEEMESNTWTIMIK